MRGESDEAARRRLERAFDTGDAALLAQFGPCPPTARLRVIV